MMAHLTRSSAISISSVTTILSECSIASVSIVGETTTKDGTNDSPDDSFSFFDSDDDDDGDSNIDDHFIGDDDIPDELRFNGLFVGSLFSNVPTPSRRNDSELSDPLISSTESLLSTSNDSNSSTASIAIPCGNQMNQPDDFLMAFSPESQMIIMPWSPEESKQNEQAVKERQELQRQVTDANARWNEAMETQEPRKKKVSVTFAEAPQVITFDPQDELDPLLI